MDAEQQKKKRSCKLFMKEVVILWNQEPLQVTLAKTKLKVNYWTDSGGPGIRGDVRKFVKNMRTVPESCNPFHQNST